MYFAAKDENLPVFVQIRKNKDGIPSSIVIPFSETVITSSNINISSNANVATTVSFPSPVFLDIGEYSLTLGSDSKNYQVYISELDNTDITSQKLITEQPLTGSLYKSQNASVWSASQLEDLKFTLYRANFSTNVTSTVNFYPETNYTRAFLTNDSLEFYPSSNVLKVFHFNHGLVENSFIKFEKLANANVNGNVGTILGINGDSLQGPYFQISNVKFGSYTINLPTQPNISTVTRLNDSAIVTQDIQYDSITPTISTIVPSNTTIEHKLITTTPSSTTYAVGSSYVNVNNNEENKFENSKVFTGFANRVNKLSNAHSLNYRVELTSNNPYVSPVIDTKQIGAVLKRNLVNNETYNSSVFLHEINFISNARSNIFEVSGSTGLIELSSSADRANARAIIDGTILTLSSNSANINDGQYRVVDVLNNGANIKIFKLSGNVVRDLNSVYLVRNSPAFIAEEAAIGGSAYSKYITKQINVVNQSTSIKFFLDVCKPSDADVKFYYKTKLAADNKNFSDVEYTEVSNVSIQTSLSGEYYEIEKQVNNIPAFNSIVFKIVLNSTNTAKPPKIKNLRIIILE